MIALAATALHAADKPDFAREIQPILAEHCFTCHGPDAAQRQAGLRLDLASVATAKLESGATAIVPGKPADSELIRRIEATDPDVVMPPPTAKKQPTADDKRKLRAWVAAGGEYAGHWAFQAPSRPQAPKVSQPQWLREPVDAFVLQQIEAAKLSPSSVAPRETLLRRLALDLTGLPPSVNDLAEFLSDESPDALERAVDRYFASPHFGEKLAQEWLDLARFGDTSGYQDDNDRPNHPYRDAIIDVSNRNMPFDEFTVASLAGDLLPTPTMTDRILSGFNRLHRYNEEGGSDPEEFRIVYAVDRTNTTAATWLGVTFACAQCHDHKYDPFTQREYYQMLAFFNSLKGEITVSKGPANPPQIRVPDPPQRDRLDRLTQEIAGIRAKLGAQERQADVAFAAWLKNPPANLTTEKSAKAGAAGGLVARSAAKAYYADVKLASPLSLDTPIKSSGRAVIVKAINSDVEVAHFATQATTGTPGVGWSVAEGPRFFAHIAFPDGTVIHSPAINGQLAIEYEWTCSYDPSVGVVALEILQGGKSIGKTSHTLTAAQRATKMTFDAFGLSYRGINAADTPIELFIDDVTYTASDKGETRTQNFDADPQWTGFGNEKDGHRFGYAADATTSAPDGLSPAKLLAIPADQRTIEQTARLKRYFIEKNVPDLAAAQAGLAAREQERTTMEQTMPLVLVWEEMETPRPTQMLVRGDYQQPGEEVARNTPAVFPPLDANAKVDRLAFAKWLVRGDHPLTSRVAANRYWKLIFGNGLVRTPEDFGTRGEPPTHPELLDWIAVEFQSDWDVKRLLRRMTSSATYRQSSATPVELRQRDPDNRLMARGPRYRLSAEEIRDAALTSADLLSRRLGGRSVFPYQPDHFYRDKEDDPNEWQWKVETGAELYRRGLYTFIRRTSPYPSFQAFDVSGRGECTIARARTNTPLQALVTLNDPVFIEAARVLAERTLKEGGGDASQRIAFIAQAVLTRSPTKAEAQILTKLYEAELARYRSDSAAAESIRSQGRALLAPGLDVAEVAAWTTVTNAVLNLDEAITRE